VLSDLYAERDRILAQLEALSIFPNTRTVRQLRRELKEKLDRIEEKIERLEREEDEKALEDEEEEEDEDSEQEDANLQRSKGMKKYHRYIRLIHDNYPEYSYSYIRTMLAQRKRGRDVDIPDVVWQNPSP
jgi:phosphoglycerate-specific signal transduction histidine kinase